MNNPKLKPASVFEQFARINNIPRPSKREEKMIDYLLNWGKSHNLETKVDETGNVLIRKAATKGYENRKTVILQSHMDMVCDKLVDVSFDFDHDPIKTHIEGDWLTAEGTTLGADDGIGCAIELAILDDDTIEHGPIECVFTRDEETQLTGATGMEAGFMNGDMLINLDSEDEGQIFVSCAGGRTTTATFTFSRQQPLDSRFYFRGSLKGLKGGHSGDDIEKKRANAIKILSRFLFKHMDDLSILLVSFNSGRMHNAIPRDGSIVFSVPSSKKEETVVAWNSFASEVKDEFHVTDTDMEFKLETADAVSVIEHESGINIVRALQAVDNGVFAMCQDEALANMVETSSNLASIVTTDNEIKVVASQRSNVTSCLDNMCNTVKAVFQLANANVEQTEGYPAWKMRTNSELTNIVVDSYKRLFGKSPIVRGIHAGLECGLFSQRYPNLDMVSFGPTLRNVHTPDERLYIPTVEMVWHHLLDILKNIPTRER